MLHDRDRLHAVWVVQCRLGRAGRRSTHLVTIAAVCGVDQPLHDDEQHDEHQRGGEYAQVRPPAADRHQRCARRAGVSTKRWYRRRTTGGVMGCRVDLDRVADRSAMPCGHGPSRCGVAGKASAPFFWSSATYCCRLFRACACRDRAVENQKISDGLPHGQKCPAKRYAMPRAADSNLQLRRGAMTTDARRLRRGCV